METQMALGLGKEKTPRQSRNYWKSGLFFTGGHAWGITEGLRTVCLGQEDEALALLASQGAQEKHES